MALPGNHVSSAIEFLSSPETGTSLIGLGPRRGESLELRLFTSRRESSMDQNWKTMDLLYRRY